MSNVRVLGRFGWIDIDEVKLNDSRVYSIDPISKHGDLVVIDHFERTNSPIVAGFSHNGDFDNGYSNVIFFTRDHELIASNNNDSEFGFDSGEFIINNFSKLAIAILNIASFNNNYRITLEEQDSINKMVDNNRLDRNLISNENSNLARIAISRLIDKHRGIITCYDYNTMLLNQAIAIIGGYNVARIQDTVNFRLTTNDRTNITMIQEVTKTNVDITKIPKDVNNNQIHLVYNYGGNVWFL